MLHVRCLLVSHTALCSPEKSAAALVSASSVFVSRLSVTPLSQSSWSVPADNFMSVCHTGQCRPGHCKMMSHQSVSSWSVPADNFMSVCHTGQCHPGQCQMMSHRSVSSWSVPDDVTPVSVAGQYQLITSCRSVTPVSVVLVSAR